MRNTLVLCWYLWEGLPSLLAFPIDSSETSGNRATWFSHWEDHWPRYTIGTLGFVVVAFTLAGCLCCRRQRRPKGFQDDAGNGKEFKDGSTAGTETTIERHTSASLELEVPRIGSSALASSLDKVQFESLPIERIAADCRASSKPKPPSPSLFSDEREHEKNLLRDQPCREWYERGSVHVPRERLKYLREIGRGWFGKVVEGTTLDGDDDDGTKSRGVVVRILTEEATTREKAWFLGEATPYLKLRHPKILTLLGSCLETDPYLLLFESCPAGDLKGFLRSNRDKGTCEALRRENVPTRMALDIANALEHMHENGFAHTDLSARNCLVAPDLSIKLGDYGTGVEKYPSDYYVVGDRALPIRWSAPESLDCTATTIETRAITPRANLWSYGVLLWEMATWGERPYDDLGDEQVIEMIFSLKTSFSSRDGLATLRKLRVDELAVAQNFVAAIESSRKFFPDERSSLRETREIICGKRNEDFESRWENLRPNATSESNRSASLHDLRASIASEKFGEEGTSTNVVQAQFRLGPDEPVNNAPTSRPSEQGSGSETEEESWRGRVERGAYTEKVKQKSKSVADLMILVHIDSDSDAEISLGPQSGDKTSKKRLPASGSDGDLRGTVLADEFDEALRKLREPSVCNGAIPKIGKNHQDNERETDIREKPKLLTLTQQGQTPILRLSLGNPENPSSSITVEKIDDRGDTFLSGDTTVDEYLDRGAATKSSPNVIACEREENSRIVDTATSSPLASSNRANEQEAENSTRETSSSARTESPRVEAHVLRLVSKGEPELPLLRYVPEGNAMPEKTCVADKAPRLDSFLSYETVNPADFSNDHAIARANASSVDVDLWNNALARELEKKIPRYDVAATIFENFDNTSIVDDSMIGGTMIGMTNYRDVRDNEDSIDRSSSVPNTPSKHENSTTRSFSAPDTPRHLRRDVVDEDPINGSSSVAVYSIGNRDEDTSTGEDLEASERIPKGSSSAPDTPQSRGNYSVGNGDEDSSTGEELESGVTKRSSHEADDEEDRKLLSTPDDERSSDSGFRDKESCEEEESPIPCNAVSNIIISNAISSSGNATNSSPFSASAEEEQMRILFELDTILDAEYYGSFHDSDRLDDSDALSSSDVRVHFDDGDDVVGKNRSFSESLESEESTDVVETVRANSCEPDFLDSRGARETVDETELRRIGNFLKNEGREETKNSLEICDSTEADSISSECSMKIDKNPSVDTSTDNRASARQSLSTDSEKNRNADLSTEQRRSIIDASESREKFDASNESAARASSHDDGERRNESPIVSEVADLADSSSESPIKTDKNISTDDSLDLRPCDASEIGKAPEIESSDSTSQSPPRTDRRSDDCDKPSATESSTSDSARTDRKSENFERSPVDASELCEATEDSTSGSPLKTDRCQTSDVSMETRPGADSGHSDAEQWSSRENVNDNDNDDEDSSTMSLRSDNSYVSFGLDEEFVAAIRNELREKLPRAQMPVIEALDPRDEKEPSINEDAETKRWEDEETDESLERGSGGVDISIRYNIYGTPLSPIMEERESAGTSESLVSKEDSRDASIASRVSALSEDVLVVDTRTNRAMMLEGTATGNGESSNLQQDDDRDTSHGDFSDEENLEYPQNNLNRGMESKRITMGSGGAPLPSPEEESKWQQQFPLPLQMQDDLMSTSFGTDRDWDSQDDDEGEDDGDDGEEDEEENSSSSGEFVWKRYDESHGDLENVATRSPPNKPKSQEPDADLEDDDEGDEDDDEEEEEFTPSAWDATLAPHRSALRSPEKTLKSGDQKKSVWFKKQRYHCVYEYPKETPMAGGQDQAATTWEPTSYADWEEMMDEPRLDVYPMEYDESNRAGDEEFYVSSSNRPFQFQSGEGKYVSQFFPGASSTLLQQQQHQMPSREAEDCQESQDEVDHVEIPAPLTMQTNGNARGLELVDSQQQMAQQSQLGELRHTRDRLKLNLLSTSGTAKADDDMGIENRIPDTDGQKSDKEIPRTPPKESDALAINETSDDTEKSLIIEDSSKETAKATSEDKKSLESAAADGEFAKDSSKTTAEPSRATSEDERSLESKIAKSDIVDDASRTIKKSLDEKISEDKSLKVKASEIAIVMDPSKETAETPEGKGNDEKLLELQTPKIEVVADSSRKIEKSLDDKLKETESLEAQASEFEIAVDSSKTIVSPKAEIDDGESLQPKIPTIEIVNDNTTKNSKSSIGEFAGEQVGEIMTSDETSKIGKKFVSMGDEKFVFEKEQVKEITRDETSKINKKSVSMGDEKSEFEKEQVEEITRDQTSKIGKKLESINDTIPAENKTEENRVKEITSTESLKIGNKSASINVEESSNDKPGENRIEELTTDESSRIGQKSVSTIAENSIVFAPTQEETPSLTKDIHSNLDEIGVSSITRNRDHLAVRGSSRAEINESVVDAGGETGGALPSDDSAAVIRDKSEANGAGDVSSSGDNSRTIGDQKGSSGASSDVIAIEQIVDITKLETNDSLASARRRVDSRGSNVEKSETTEDPSASYAGAGVSSTNEKIDEHVVVQSSQS